MMTLCLGLPLFQSPDNCDVQILMKVNHYSQYLLYSIFCCGLSNALIWLRFSLREFVSRNVLLPTENSKAVQESVVEVGSVGGLAVDWVHDRLYWSDTAAAQLEVSRLNGVARQVLYRDGWPSSIVVDPLLGLVVWLEISDEITLEYYKIRW